MIALIIREKDGEQRHETFDGEEVNIGRVRGNDVVLPRGNVSKKHARLFLRDGKVILQDLKSTNGTFVNGRKLSTPKVIGEGDKIHIGDFVIGLDAAATAQAQVAVETPAAGVPPAPPPPKRPPTQPPPPPPQAMRNETEAPPTLSETDAPIPESRAPSVAPPPPPPGPPVESAPREPKVSEPPPVSERVPRPTQDPVVPDEPAAGVSVVSALPQQIVDRCNVQRGVVMRASEELRLGQMTTQELADENLWQRAESVIADIVGELQQAGEIPGTVDEAALVAAALNETLALGPLEDILADPSVNEIFVDRADSIFVGRGAGVIRVEDAFSSDEAIERVIGRMLGVQELEETVIEARAGDGSRLTAVLPPTAANGPCFHFRRQSPESNSLDGLIAQGQLEQEAADYLAAQVEENKNILVAGNSTAGILALIGALADLPDASERVVTIESVAQLNLGRRNWTALESASGETVESLIRTAQRLRPDRIVVGEIIGAEALAVVNLMGASSRGTVAGLNALSVADALGRLVALGGLGAPGVTFEQIAHVVEGAVDVVAFVNSSGQVSSIELVSGFENGGFLVDRVIG